MLDIPSPITTQRSGKATAYHAATSDQIQVIKRTGNAVPFDAEKITHAMMKAFLAEEGQLASGSSRARDAVDNITKDICSRIHRRLPSGGSIHIEDIQDLVELGLMRQGFQKIARAYVLYREEHRIKRTDGESKTTSDSIQVLNAEGKPEQLVFGDIEEILHWASGDIDDIDINLLIRNTRNALYQGIRAEDIPTAMIIAVRPLIEADPGYSYVCARLLLNNLSDEAFRGVGLDTVPCSHLEAEHYSRFFQASIKQCVEHELLSEQLLKFNLPVLAEALQPERDKLFTYLGLQTLYDRYFLHWNGTRLELPQTFFMRVAMGLALNEDDPTARAIEFYHVLSSFDYMTSTPTLFNAGTQRPQLSSCYLTTIPDDLEGIYSSLKENALLSKWAGGLGNDWTPVRALGAHIKGTNGQSQGIVPFLKVVNDTAVAVNQGGKRKGAVCAYLETWHLDIEEFLELRKNTGDERRRTHDMNTANWIPDLFMKRVSNDEEWTLFSPDDVPDLHDLYGKAFESRYHHYEDMAQQGLLPLHKTVSATQLWRKMLSMLFETGHPWITFKDPSNIRSPQQHSGVIHSSNLCTEITLNTSENETAVCNLGSINLVNHIHDGHLDQEHLARTIQTAVRMLDNVIDINYYAVDKASNANLKHRPVGLGLMGFQDALYALNIPYASVAAVDFADQSMELISYYAIHASALLARERGPYQSYTGSLWDQGILPIDSQQQLVEQRGQQFCTMDNGQQLDWQPVRALIAQYGMRNSNVMAIAPTATIANIVGVSQSIEPTYQNLFVKSNLSGEFTVVNPWLVKALKEQGLWDDIMRSDLKYFDGALKQIDRIPDDLKQLFSTAFEIDSRWLVEAAARRQKWIDQAQSLNIYLAEPSGKQLDNIYKLAWSRGLKTTYYLRSLGATHMEKGNNPKRDESSANALSGSALSNNALSNHETSNNDIPLNQPKVCSILDPDCEACQ